MRILAHRTGMAISPENSYEGLVACHNAGAHVVECDIIFVGEKPFVWINKSVQNSSMGLKDVWRFIKEYPDIKVFFDIKYYDVGDIDGHFCKISGELLHLVLTKIIAPAIHKELLNRIGFVTFKGGAEVLSMAKNYTSQISTELIVIFPWFSLGFRPDLDSICIGWKKFNHWKCFPKALRRIMNEAREAGLQIVAGLANTPEEYKWVAENKFDGVWTDNPFAASSFYG